MKRAPLRTHPPIVVLFNYRGRKKKRLKSNTLCKANMGA